jgi:hypothetical protein
MCAMTKPDLDMVVARRATVVRELADLEKLRAEREAEDQELAVAERVLKRLSEATAARAARTASSEAPTGQVKGRWDGPILDG